MEGKKHKSKKIKTKVISGITIVMLILGISIFYRKETKTNINIQGQSIHTYTGTHTETDDTQYTYNIIYEYKDSNDDSIYESCRVTISTIFSGVVPDGWSKVGGEGNTTNDTNGISIFKDYYLNVDQESVSLGRDILKITVNKIGAGTIIETDTQHTYQISYTYFAENGIINKCKVEITMYGAYLNEAPRGWEATSQSKIYKFFTENEELTLTDKDYNNGGTKIEDININVSKIGNYVDKTQNYTIQFKDKNLYDAIIQNDEIKANLVNQDNVACQIVMTGENIEKVTTLNLANKNITDLTGIGSFSKLTYLQIANNNITNLAEVNKLTNLTNLHANNNQIADMADLNGLKSLKWLNLSNNQITDIHTNLTFSNIECLFFSDNEIEDITPLTSKLKAIGKKELDSFDLSGNKIKDISTLEEISYMDRGGVRNQRINIKADTQQPIPLPQIIQKAIADNAEISYIDCTKQNDNTVIVNANADGNHEISVQVNKHQGKWSTTGTKLTITPNDLPTIVLYHIQEKDTYIKLDNDNKINLPIRVSNMSQDMIGRTHIKIKIGEHVVEEGTLTNLFDYTEHNIYELKNSLGDTGTSIMNGRLTIEIPAIEGVIKETILDTKYIVDNTPPSANTMQLQPNNGKTSMILELNEDISKLREDGKEYTVIYNEDNHMSEIRPSGGWKIEKSRYGYLEKEYDTTGEKTVTLIDRAGNESVKKFTIGGWISEIELNSPAGTYIKGNTITVTAKYKGEDIANSETTKLEYAIGTGEAKTVEGQKDITNKTITYTITIEQNDIGKLQYKRIQGGRTDQALTPDFTSIEVKQLNGIEITQPTKTTYIKGEKLDLTGLRVTAKYTDNTLEEIENKNYTVTPSNGETLTETGRKIITVTYEGKTATFTITINPQNIAATSVTLNKTEVSMKEGHTESLIATVAPENATNKNVIWKSSNETIAKISSSGVVTANKKGAATITVTTQDGGKTATCQVTVTENTTEEEKVAVTGVTLNKTTTTIKEGETENLIATVVPENATNKNITWSSSNETIVKVLGGVITGVSEGTADITVTTEDGKKIATCKVTVTKLTANNPDDDNNNDNNDNNNNNNSNSDNKDKNDLQNTNKTNTLINDAKTPASKLPHAGIKETIMVVSIIALIIIAIVSFVKYKKYEIR